MLHLTFDKDFTKKEIWQIFKLAKKLKDKQKKGESHELLRGKSLAMIFQKPSTRTRVSFETAITQLGGHAQYLSVSDLQLGRGETIKDTAKVLSRYVDGIMARVFSHQDIIDLAKNSNVPVINGLSDKFHPCQALTDLFTIWEKRQKLKNLTMVFVGDGDNNVTNSLLLICDILGVELKIACPDKYRTKKEILDLAKRKIEISNNLKTIVKNADVIYTDTWISMGREDEKEREIILTPYQVNQKLVSLAKKDAIVMHCLPAHRNHEITDEIMDGPHSIIFDQAENRLHVQKAILVKLLK
ncbi:MAG: ornithine carbamoyltransferase [Candidatus Nealsonbacteria bacterium]|nr:ornithine carbamoyltransferase [Candidatus Nealsonbacteria bacterium]